MDQNLSRLIELLENDREIFQLLRQCPYEVLRHFEVKDYEPKTFVLEQGEIYNKFYIIVAGHADIYVESAHGKKYLLTTYEKCDYIGEMEIFQQTGYISRVEASGKLTVLELERTFFMQWIRVDKNFNEYMIRTLCSNSYAMCLNMGQNTLYTLKQRICQYLIAHVDENGKLKTSLSSEYLSQQMAVTSRSVNRILKQLKEEKIIGLENGKISVLDLNALKAEKREDYDHGKVTTAH